MTDVNYQPFIRNYLIACGVSDVDEYMRPTVKCSQDPSLYNNIDTVCEMIHDAVINNKRIGILVDEDVDGICSSSMVWLFLHKLGNDAMPIFHTAQKAHGINSRNGEDKVRDNLPEMDLLIIPDASIDECTAKELHCKGVLICELEHHETEPRDNVVTVNCQYQDETNHDACGTLVSFKTIQRYCQLYDIECPSYNEFIAMATIADVMDMRSLENRYYVSSFCSSNGNDNINPFFKALIDKLNKGQIPTPTDIGWRIAPTINAAFRYGSRETVEHMFNAIIGRYDIDKAITELARNKRMQDASVKDTVSRITPNISNEHSVVFAFIENEERSFSGLVANKLLSKYSKPALVLRENSSTTWSGSLRSPIPLLEQINESKLAECSGHGSACGIQVKKCNLTKLARWLDTLDLDVEPDIEVTASIKCNDITIPLCEACEDGKDIWGMGIPQPTFHITLHSPTSYIFKKSITTIKLVDNNISFLLFFAKNSDVEQLSNCDGKDIDVIFTLGINEYNGVVSPQCNIKQYEVHSNEEEFNWEDVFK